MIFLFGRMVQDFGGRTCFDKPYYTKLTSPLPQKQHFLAFLGGKNKTLSLDSMQIDCAASHEKIIRF